MARGGRIGIRDAKSEMFATIRHAKAQATARATQHHQESRETRLQVRTDALLVEFGVTSGAAPAWATRHLRDIARECATRMVDDKLDHRLFQIDRAGFRMSLTGNVRGTRSTGRDVGLGE